MSDLTGRLDAIDARLAAAAPGAITITPSDVAYLRDMARKQQAALGAVRDLHRVQQPQEGDVIGPYCSECTSPIDGGPELWPCPTIKALER